MTTPTRARMPLAALVSVLALVWGLLAAPTASAHSALVGSDPADGATLAAAPRAVSLTFNETVKGQYSKILVTGPDGAQLPVTTSSAGPTVTASLPAGLGGGAYRVVYSVVSADTHRISGQITFTVKGAPAASTVSATTPSATSSSAPSAAPTTSAVPRRSSGGAWGWIFPLVSLGLVIPLVWAGRRQARRKSRATRAEELDEHLR
ncbi:copper resistance protein CopC [Arsenicicoccus dermatophilus]|uniref:copper resistance CopC family protein n=1 Tax=Arsenicicoccus dermatophilus TaxID=1076331 RepID=UPI00391729BA